MSIATLTLNNYIMVAGLMGLWVMLESNVHLKKRTIAVTRIVILLHEALKSGMWGMEFDDNGNMISVEWSQEFNDKKTAGL
ncbi:MAG: hypothetical protein K6G27_08470 [Lachnospiraceae bacterium]|nr:hypothetical protein [Lachnospiraceae bacterium]